MKYDNNVLTHKSGRKTKIIGSKMEKNKRRIGWKKDYQKGRKKKKGKNYNK